MKYMEELNKIESAKHDNKIIDYTPEVSEAQLDVMRKRHGFRFFREGLLKSEEIHIAHHLKMLEEEMIGFLDIDDYNPMVRILLDRFLEIEGYIILVQNEVWGDGSTKNVLLPGSGINPVYRLHPLLKSEYKDLLSSQRKTIEALINISNTPEEAQTKKRTIKEWIAKNPKRSLKPKVVKSEKKPAEEGE